VSGEVADASPNFYVELTCAISPGIQSVVDIPQPGSVAASIFHGW